MANKYLTTMKQYDGTNYTTLYPKVKSNGVLLDKTAQGYMNLSSGATLNDALQSIKYGGATYQVGDVLITARTDLGDKWLLCNGALVSATEYTDLVPLLPNSIGSPVVSTSSTTADVTFANIGKKGEIILGTDYKNAGSIQYPFNTNPTFTSVSGFRARPSYSASDNNYYSGSFSSFDGTTASYPYLYGSSLNSLVNSANSYPGYPCATFNIDGDIYIVYLWRKSGCKPEIYKVNADKTLTLVGTFSRTADWYSLNMYWVKMVKFNNVLTICFPLYDYTIGAYFSQQSGSTFTAINCANYVDAFAVNGAIALSSQRVSVTTGTSSLMWSKDLSTWTEVSSIPAATKMTVCATPNGFLCTVYDGTNTSVYQAATTDVDMWNKVTTIQDKIVETIVEGSTNRVYFVGVRGKIYTSSITGNIVLPTYSPADGLYAYIKAKK